MDDVPSVNQPVNHLALTTPSSPLASSQVRSAPTHPIHMRKQGPRRRIPLQLPLPSPGPAAGSRVLELLPCGTAEPEGVPHTALRREEALQCPGELRGCGEVDEVVCELCKGGRVAGGKGQSGSESESEE